ncbi:hypothetical protein ES705_20770 [subsurface metagenome]
MDLQEWSLLVQCIMAVTAILALIIGYFKLDQYMKDRKSRFESEVKWKTEKAYENYKISECLTRATNSIFKKTADGTDYSKIEFNYDVAVVINYLESIAIGIDQGIYNEKMIRNYLEGAIYKATKVFLLGEGGDYRGRKWKASKVMIKPHEQPFLIKLYNKWFEKSIDSNYKTEFV